MGEFSDNATVTILDPQGDLLWDKIKPESTVEVIIGEESHFFRLGNISMTYPPRQLTLSLISRESEFSITEIKPKHWTGSSDNAIIKELFPDFTLNLAPEIKIKEADSSIGETASSVAIKVASENGFYLWASGGIINKQKIASSGLSVKEYGHYEMLDYSFNGDYSSMRSKLSAFSSDSKHEKLEATKSIIPSSIFSGQSFNISREIFIQTSSKDRAELNRAIEENIHEMQPKETGEFTVRGRDHIAINSIVGVHVPTFKISLQMVVYKKVFNVSESGEITTTISVTGLGRSF
jgi:hypothetical protein